MSKPSFHLRDDPSALSLGLLIRRLRDDAASKEINPKNYAHRLRVIRQQTELLALQSAGLADENRELASRTI